MEEPIDAESEKHSEEFRVRAWRAEQLGNQGISRVTATSAATDSEWPARSGRDPRIALIRIDQLAVDLAFELRQLRLRVGQGGLYRVQCFFFASFAAAAAKALPRPPPLPRSCRTRRR
jgi:hypothetical protein